MDWFNNLSEDGQGFALLAAIMFTFWLLGRIFGGCLGAC